MVWYTTNYTLKGLNPGSSINLIYCMIIQIKFLIVSDVLATYTAAIIKDILQLQKIYSYNNYPASKWRAHVREVVCSRMCSRHESLRPAYAPGISRQMLMLFSSHFVNQLSNNILSSSKPLNSIQVAPSQSIHHMETNHRIDMFHAQGGSGVSAHPCIILYVLYTYTRYRYCIIIISSYCCK
jgi:hypothetical protein